MQSATKETAARVKQDIGSSRSLEAVEHYRVFAGGSGYASCLAQWQVEQNGKAQPEI